MQPSDGSPIEILLVEDSPTDTLMDREALEYSRIVHRLHVAEDGEQAMAFLRREKSYVGAPRPDLILLDLNLPKKTGREVLAEIKSDEDLKTIPVVVLTTSKAEDDVKHSYGSHANCYITKPAEFDQLVNVVRAIQGFWFKVVTLPPL